MTLKFDGWPRKTIGQFFHTKSSFVHHFKSIGEFILEWQSRNAKFRSKLTIFCPVWTWNLMDDLGNNRAPLLYYTKHCASFQIHWCSQTWVTVLKCSIRVKDCGVFLSSVTLKFDGWPWKTTGHLFYTTLSFVHHFKAIGEFKLEQQSGNAQFGSKSEISCPVWPWNLTDDLEKQ